MSGTHIGPQAPAAGDRPTKQPSPASGAGAVGVDAVDNVGVDDDAAGDAAPVTGAAAGAVQPTGEHGGPKGPEPTRYGDWEKGGRCFDF